jgi:hypothetical protein
LVRISTIRVDSLTDFNGDVFREVSRYKRAITKKCQVIPPPPPATYRTPVVAGVVTMGNWEDDPEREGEYLYYGPWDYSAVNVAEILLPREVYTLI